MFLWPMRSKTFLRQPISYRFVVQPEREPGDSDGHGAGNVDCVPLANEKQDISPLANEKQDNSPLANERRALTALWSSQKENQETVTVMEEGT